MQSYILILEIDLNVAFMLQEKLERHGYRVETAYNTVEALAKITANRPDLLITDWMPDGIMNTPMSEVAGYELVGHIRRNPALSDMPVITLTNMRPDIRRDDLDRVLLDNGAKIGIKYCLIKPFNPAQLIQAVERLVPKSMAKT